MSPDTVFLTLVLYFCSTDMCAHTVGVWGVLCEDSFMPHEACYVPAGAAQRVEGEQTFGKVERGV